MFTVVLAYKIKWLFFNENNSMWVVEWKGLGTPDFEHISGHSFASRTCFEAADRERCLGEKVLVVEHVDFIDHEAQEGKGRIEHGESEGFSGPGGVQTVVR